MLEKHCRIVGNQYLKIKSCFRYDGPSKYTWSHSEDIHSQILVHILTSSVTGSMWVIVNAYYELDIRQLI